MGKRIYDKAIRQRENNPENSLPHATAKYIRISPYKVRAVLDLIRGKSYRQAVGILENLNKSSCDPILKALKSAGANAENNQGRSTDSLFVAKCYANPAKAEKELGWKAELGLDRMCADSWRWQSQNPQGY